MDFVHKHGKVAVFSRSAPIWCLFYQLCPLKPIIPPPHWAWAFGRIFTHVRRVSARALAAPGRATAQCPVPAARDYCVIKSRKDILKMFFPPFLDWASVVYPVCISQYVWPMFRLTSVQCLSFLLGSSDPCLGRASYSLDWTPRPGALSALSLASSQHTHTITHPRTHEKKTQKYPIHEKWEGKSQCSQSAGAVEAWYWPRECA